MNGFIYLALKAETHKVGELVELVYFTYFILGTDREPWKMIV